MQIRSMFCVVPGLVLLLTACESADSGKAGIQRTGFLQTGALDEASGMVSGRLNPDTYFLHNDDGQPILYAIGSDGRDRGRLTVEGAKNRDWEDITLAPTDEGPLLIIGDTGDNGAQWQNVTLYFLREPAPGPDQRFSGTADLLHSVTLKYPDGPRDCESLAFDPASGDLLLVSKRDKPPRIYRVALETALANQSAELEFAGETARFRPPTSRDMLYFGQRDGPWVSQPTGLDIRPDGRQAAIISYRSTYIFERAEGEDWPAALARVPAEFEGPPSRKEEAIAYSSDGQHILVTAEGIPAPVYRITLRPGP